ncbi:hypothetical protein [Marinisporobacter balticus]|uniref:Uncharacterized protein n=1 Tax=Marinisporobacter balticus TaxID=2018667 RepID=A0A4V2S9R9_9FIRM|nr:hypothetical protein [Marinisporobacter balticus]TCO68090.1 hypothetical protein EV214_1481 [Marinisporobacter balticus]
MENTVEKVILTVVVFLLGGLGYFFIDYNEGIYATPYLIVFGILCLGIYTYFFIKNINMTIEMALINLTIGVVIYILAVYILFLLNFPKTYAMPICVGILLTYRYIKYWINLR